MAASARPFTFAQAVVAAVGTSVAPSAPIPDNCRAVTLLNIGANVALWGIAAPGAALVEGTNAARLAAGASITIPCGPISERGIMDESQLTASGFVYDALVGGTTIDVIYQNILGTSY